MSKKVTFCGVCAAVSIVLLLLTAVFSLNKLVLAGAATLAFPIIVVRYDKKTALAALFCAGVLAFFVVPNKFLALFYVLLGLYSIVKELIEKSGNFTLEWVIKLAIYFVCTVAALLIFNTAIKAKILVIAVGAVVFAAYDIALSLGISYCMKYLKNVSR